MKSCLRSDDAVTVPALKGFDVLERGNRCIPIAFSHSRAWCVGREPRAAWNDKNYEPVQWEFLLIPWIVSEFLFKSESLDKWPKINPDLLIEDDIDLPIQIQGKMITTIKTKKGYNENDILKSIYLLDKIKNKINNRKILKVINVQDKIINIIIT